MATDSEVQQPTETVSKAQPVDPAHAVSKRPTAEHAQASALAAHREGVVQMKRVAAFSEATFKKVTKLDDVMAALAEVKQVGVIQTLQWAMTNSETGSFEFYDRKTNTIKTSGLLVKEIMGSFMKGLGRGLHNEWYDSSGSRDEKSRAAFRTKLAAHVHLLTGVKPRLEKEKNGDVEQWAMYRH